MASFSIELQGEEKLVVLAEVERTYWSSNRSHPKSNGRSASKEMISPQDLLLSIRREISKNHDLQVYTTLLLKPGSLPKTSSGKIQRHACRTEFLANTLEGLPV